jgi:hypothetical protein
MVAQAAWHRQALRISSMLTETFYDMRHMERAMANPRKVIQTLKKASPAADWELCFIKLE